MNKYDYFRLIYALLLGYAISYKCKMDENDGKILIFCRNLTEKSKKFDENLLNF